MTETMTLWLLNTFSTPVLALLLVVGLPVLAVVLQRFARTKFSSVAAGEHNEMAGRMVGVLVGMFGLVLAFTIVSMYENFSETQRIIEQEATALAELDRDALAFSPAAGTAIDMHIGEYAHAVVDEEWGLLGEGHESLKAWDEIDELYSVLQGYTPEAIPQRAFYSASISDLKELVAQRRSRLSHVDANLPDELLLALFGGAVLVVAFLTLFGGKSATASTLMIAAVATLIGFNLLLVVLLDRPFSGSITVSNQAFREGRLAHHFGD